MRSRRRRKLAGNAGVPFIGALLGRASAKCLRRARSAENSWKWLDSQDKRSGMQRGSAEIFLGLGLIILGILALKLTDHNYWWALIALGAVVGSHGGISVSQRARV